MPHAVFDRPDSGNWMASAIINYFITAIILIFTTIALVRNYGFFPGLTFYVIGLALVVGALIYRPCKLLWPPRRAQVKTHRDRPKVP